MKDDMRKRLMKQIVEQHGKIVYSITTNEKEIGQILFWKKVRQIISIILSAITVSPAFSSLFDNNLFWNFFSAIAGIILLCLSSYNLRTDSDSILIELKTSADSLWEIREKYVSLLIDFDAFEIEQIRNKRDELVRATADVYKKRPKTSQRAYSKAQKAIQDEEEQTFNKGEAELLLPEVLRKE
ncbi:SLATT domain-containing protein [Streptococcus uberis]|uniref:SLATT domain-containing protein n=1 Tax=Streptococcus uberis TaxID=1349 RepID=UPI003891A36F